VKGFFFFFQLTFFTMAITIKTAVRKKKINMAEKKMALSTTASWRDNLRTALQALKEEELEEDERVQRIEALAQEVKTFIDGPAWRFSTQCVYYAQANTMFKKFLGPEARAISVTFLIPKKELKLAHMREVLQANLCKLENRPVTVSSKDYFRAIAMLKTSNQYFDRMACAILATGRRPTEIAQTAEFSLVGDTSMPGGQESQHPEVSVDTTHRVWFKGQLKRRTDALIIGQETDSDAVLIPVLGLLPAELIAMMKTLREVPGRQYANKGTPEGNFEPSEIAAKTNQGCNEALRSVFAKIYGCDSIKCAKLTALSAHVFRGCWAYISYRLFANPADTEVWWSAKALGHRLGDTGSFSLHYNRTRVEMNGHALEPCPSL
jgi:hypothetical protein